MPHVSVVIPIYNRADLLPRALRSVLSQTYQDFEIIVVDDGSTDRIAPVIESLGDARVLLVRHERQCGAGAARNTGIRQARGDYIAFLDSDDEWLPEKLDRQLRVLTHASNGYEMCVASYELRRHGRVSVEVPPPEQDVPSEISYSDLLWGCSCSPGTTLVVSRQVFERTGLFHEELRRLEDWDWLLRAAQVYRLALVAPCSAVIHGSRGPIDPEKVTAALRELRSRRRIYGLSWVRPISALKFEATIMLERAAVAYRSGSTSKAFLLGTISVLAYPFRNRAFYARAFKLARELIRG